MEELQSALGDHGDAPALDTEMTDELTGAHVPGVLKLLLGQLLEPELPGHVVEDAMSDRSGIGNGSIEIKKVHSLRRRRDEGGEVPGHDRLPVIGMWGGVHCVTGSWKFAVSVGRLLAVP